MKPCYGAVVAMSVPCRTKRRGAQRRVAARIQRHLSRRAEESAVADDRSRTVCAVARLCSRTGCSEAAGVTLSYDYARSCVWLDALSAERHPHHYDLCRRHADRLTAPVGWEVRDRRTGASTLLAV